MESLIRGRKGYLILYRVTWKRTFGTYTKQIVFGGLSHIIKVFYQCKGGKNVKHRVTIALLANVGGEKEAAAVIGSLKVWGGTSRKQTGANFLPYNYFSHSKGWMTGEIVDKIVSKFREHHLHNRERIKVCVSSSSRVLPKDRWCR